MRATFAVWARSRWHNSTGRCHNTTRWGVGEGGGVTPCSTVSHAMFALALRLYQGRCREGGPRHLRCTFRARCHSVCGGGKGKGLGCCCATLFKS
jgi:hypothetical protein